MVKKNTNKYAINVLEFNKYIFDEEWELGGRVTYDMGNNEIWDIDGISTVLLNASPERKGIFSDVNNAFFYYGFLNYLAIVEFSEIEAHLNYYYSIFTDRQKEVFDFLIETKLDITFRQYQHFGVNIYRRKNIISDWLYERRRLENITKSEPQYLPFTLNDNQISLVISELLKSEKLENDDENINSLRQFFTNELHVKIKIKSSQRSIIDLFRRMIFANPKLGGLKTKIALILGGKVNYFKAGKYKEISAASFDAEFTDASKVPTLENRILLNMFPEIHKKK